MRHLGWPAAGALAAVAVLAACPTGEELHDRPWLVINRDPWVMDPAYVGTSVQDSIYLENQGLEDLVLTSVTYAGSGAFSRLPSRPNPEDGGVITNPTTLTLAPRKRSYFALSFSPPAAGSFTGQITIVSNAENAPTKVLEVSANGFVYDGGM